MLDRNETLLSLNDVTLIPATISYVESRKQCATRMHDGMLPLFAAPMSCVIDDNNWKTFQENGVRAVVPRSIGFSKRLELAAQTFVAAGLDEMKEIAEMPAFSKKNFICVDIANGHMESLYMICRKAKERHGENISIMTGNIANPETYKWICSNHPGVIDYIRVGIGNGNVCTTSANTAIHYPMASLISHTYANKSWDNPCPEIVADGGFTNFDQIVKALALGADYVMLGKIFAKTEESCADYVYDEDGEPVHDENHNLVKEYYGMSTRKAQKEFGGGGLKTAEGISTTVSVEYRLSQWVNNFESFLKSAMSYAGKQTILSFIGGVTLMPMTSSAYSSYFK